MRVTSDDSELFFKNDTASGLFQVQEKATEKNGLKQSNISDPDLLNRARDREKEERDLRVLDAYNRFEHGLQEILTKPESGVMARQAGEAQAAVFEINDYFNEQGGMLSDQLPDEKCRMLFMDILASRRNTAVNAVARHQSQEYQKWKDHTAAATIDSIIRVVNISPDAASLRYGEQLLEGTITRLYRSSSPEIKSLKLNSARQAMYAGALESIAATDPVTAVIVLESWKEQIGPENYEMLMAKFEPLARSQSIKMEFRTMRDMEGDILKAELEDIAEPTMRDELAEMIMAERMHEKYSMERTEAKRFNNLNRTLFQRYTSNSLKIEDIVDSGLPEEHRARWRMVFSTEGRGSDKELLDIVSAIIADEITEEYQIYAAMAEGLGKIDAALLATLFQFRDNPEAKLMVYALEELEIRGNRSGNDEAALAAAIRDFLNRTATKVLKGEVFSICSLRNEVIKDYFSSPESTSGTETPRKNTASEEIKTDKITKLRNLEPDIEEQETEK